MFGGGTHRNILQSAAPEKPALAKCFEGSEANSPIQLRQSEQCEAIPSFLSRILHIVSMPVVTKSNISSATPSLLRVLD